MSDFITLTCPSCGNKLQITKDIDRFACAACGNEHIVNRSGGIVTLTPLLADKDAGRKAFLQRAINDWNGVLEQEAISPNLRKEVLELIAELNKELEGV